MKRSIVLHYNIIERLAENDRFDNIIVGTGMIAQDMYRKLSLLGQDVSYAIGDREDEEKRLLHYQDINKLGDPKRYRFIFCTDLDEWELMINARSAVYRFLGVAANNHPQVLFSHAHDILNEKASKIITDASCGNTFFRDGKPYTVYGDERDGKAFFIHLLGGCGMDGIARNTQVTFAEHLSEKLKEAGFRAAVFAWGQSASPFSDSMLRFMRDVCHFRIDLLILFSGIADLNPLNTGVRNMLSTREGGMTGLHRFIRQLPGAYEGKRSNGMDHDVGLLDIRKAQQRFFLAMARHYGFSYWEAVPPNSATLPEKAAQCLRGLSAGYLARQRTRKNELIQALDENITKDYSDVFDDVDDIFAMFTDDTHISGTGNALLAGRCSQDIISAFGCSALSIR